MNACAEIPGVAPHTFFDAADTLIYGIGNVGRQDDGLGWAFIDWLERENLCPAAERRRHYQLQLEDADLISTRRRVLFIDATREAQVEPFALRRVEPRLDFSFTSHAISVPAILATCQTCFSTVPEVFLLAVRGYAWDLQEGLTAGGRRNLEGAIAFFLSGADATRARSDLARQTNITTRERGHEQAAG